MNTQSQQRGVALIMALGIMALFLAVGILLLTMTTQNSQNFGNAYQKQRYYDVAEAGIDRGLKDINSVLPAPGSAGYLTATPAPPPTPSGDQTALPNVPNVPYHYSYWYNAGPAAASTADPLIAAGNFGVSALHTVNVPPQGAVIWSYTTAAIRNVAVEVIVDRFGTSTTQCALCSGGGVTVTGSNNKLTVPATVCGDTKNPFKVCSDPNPVAPNTAPTNVPIITGGPYQCSGSEPQPCAYGDGASTPNPAVVQANASPSTTSGFLASQGTIDQLSNTAGWQAASTTNTNIKYLDCTSGCSASQLQTVAPGANQVTFVNGNLDWSAKNTTLSYAGLIIVSGCVNVSQAGLKGTSNSSGVTVLGTDAQCGGTAISIGGGGNSPNALWDGGTAYAVQGSIAVSGNGSVKGYNFYGAAIAANNITVTGNGYFAWESSLATQVLNFGGYSIVSFAQY